MQRVERNEKVAHESAQNRAAADENSAYQDQRALAHLAADNSFGGTTVTGTLDCFVQFDSLGADLVARTLSGIIGRSADHNFIETARFMGQVSQAASVNPAALIDIAQRVPQVSAPTKKQFVDVVPPLPNRQRWRCPLALGRGLG